MIEITIKDNEFSYDIKALAHSFFPEEPCTIIQDERIATSSGYWIRCLFHGELLFEEHLSEPYDKNIVKQVVYDLFYNKCKKKLPWGTLTGIRPSKIPLRLLMQGESPSEIRTILKDVYYCQEDKIDLLLDIAEYEFELIKDLEHENRYAIYIAIPFCPTRCHYCSFAAYPMKQYECRVEEYLDALEKEMKVAMNAFPTRKISSVYIGGGTPTSLSDRQLERLLHMVDRHFHMEEALEYTVEAGRPDSITKEKLSVMKNHGVTRISINPQTMKQKTLEVMGRNHTINDTRRAFTLARRMGFDNINMDLIIGLPGEDLEDFKRTLDRVEQMNPDSITIHTLVIKRASKMREEQMEQGGKIIEENDVISKMQEYGLSFARKKGYQPYYMYRQKNKSGMSKNTNQENVGYAKKGKECYYNIFIMEELETILAIGAGSSSKFVFSEENRMDRVEKVKSIELYIERIDEMIARTKKYF